MVQMIALILLSIETLVFNLPSKTARSYYCLDNGLFFVYLKIGEIGEPGQICLLCFRLLSGMGMITLYPMNGMPFVLEIFYALVIGRFISYLFALLHRYDVFKPKSLCFFGILYFPL